MVNYRRAPHPGGTYFFTVVTYRRRKMLTLPESRYYLRQAIEQTRETHSLEIEAWVLLDDHLHCIWKLPEGCSDFSVRWRLIKQRFTKHTKSLFHKNEWMNSSSQVGCAFMRINDSLPVSNGYFSSGLECGGEIENSKNYMGK